MTTTRSLVALLGFQAMQIQVAEGVIDRQGLTAAYRREVLARVNRDQRDGEDYPADLVAGAKDAAECRESKKKPTGPMPIDDYLKERE